MKTPWKMRVMLTMKLPLSKKTTLRILADVVAIVDNVVGVVVSDADAVGEEGHVVAVS